MTLKQLNSPDHYPMLREAGKAKFQPPFFIQLLLFVLLFVITQIISAVILVAAMIPMMLADLLPIIKESSNALPVNGEELPYLQGDTMWIVSLFSTVIITLVSIFYCRLIEKRSMASIGLSGKKLLFHYLLGLVVGTGLFSTIVLICKLAGVVSLELVSHVSIVSILLFLAGFMLQGMSEEVLCRGYLMPSLANRSSVFTAVMVNSLIFALMHILNSNISVLAMINLTLFGILASLYTLYFNNLWGVCALHSAWNFIQGNVFGSNVSGMVFNSRLFTMTAEPGHALVHGGAFGLEGGLVMTAVAGCGILLLLLLLRKQAADRQTDSHTESLT